jgi:P27 family predicted phage terminase small subunit
MPNPSVPLNVMISTKKPHRSNKELEDRKKNEEELQTSNDKVNPPTWLDTNAKKEFKKIVKELKKVKLATNLDINSLAVYADSVVKYYEFEKEVDRLKKLLDEAYDIEDINERIKSQTQINKMIINFSTKKLSLSDNIRKYSVEFGLTPQSRARLAIPRKKEESKSEEEEMFVNV